MKKALIISAFLVGIVGLAAPAYAAGPSFTKDLYFGIQGDAEVSQLQEFLTAQGLYSGPITGNFFSLTLNGVKVLQAREGISPAAGYFGPITRAKANDLLAVDINASDAQAVAETGSTPVPQKSAMQIQLDALLQQIALLQSQLSAQKETAQIVSALNTQVSQQTQAIQTQTQTIQQQQQTTEQIQQNTTPVVQTPVAAPAPVISTVTITKSGETSLLITNNGPHTVRVKELIAVDNSGTELKASAKPLPWPWLSGIQHPNGLGYSIARFTDLYGVSPYQNQPINILECNGQPILESGSYDVCARRHDSVPDGGDRMINEITSGETVTFGLREIPSWHDGKSWQLKTLKYVAGSIIDITTGSDVVFPDVTF